MNGNCYLPGPGQQGDEWNEWEGRDPTASNAISIEGGGGGTKAFRLRLITLSKSGFSF